MRFGRKPSRCRTGGRGFSLAELLVVIGIICLLLAIFASPLQMARRHAMATRCGTQLQQLGVALEDMRTDYDYYPLWDDGASPTRYTWIDVLVENGQLADERVGYCPEDARPDPLNSARARQVGLVYPGSRAGKPGIDYSYGIAVPLSAGGWSASVDAQGRPRRFENHERHSAQRVLAGDASWSQIYNLSGDALETNDWSWPTQFDNMVAWRHRNTSANLLYQDGHVEHIVYKLGTPEPVNTQRTCLWYPGERLGVGPDDVYQENFYPDLPAFDLSNAGGARQHVLPAFYTNNLLWTRISHK